MKNCRLPITDGRWPITTGGAQLCPIKNRKSKIENGFTLIELLVVISILGLLAALSVPAIKNIGAGNTTAGSARQLLDDVGRARQLAISQRVTVYMVFVPTNFWGGLPASAALTNLVDKQLTGYNFISYGKVGDQPGRHSWRYLADWQSLPQGSFIAAKKFAANLASTYPVYNGAYSITPFHRTNAIPFPTESSSAPVGGLPFIAFNYLGQLTFDGVKVANQTQHEFIPLAQGTVSYGYNSTTKTPQLTTVTATGITENPPGNSTNISYNIIDIEPLTGRATWQHYKM